MRESEQDDGDLERDFDKKKRGDELPMGQTCYMADGQLVMFPELYTYQTGVLRANQTVQTQRPKPADVEDDGLKMAVAGNKSHFF